MEGQGESIWMKEGVEGEEGWREGERGKRLWDALYIHCTGTTYYMFICMYMYMYLHTWLSRDQDCSADCHPDGLCSAASPEEPGGDCGERASGRAAEGADHHCPLPRCSG